MDAHGSALAVERSTAAAVLRDGRMTAPEHRAARQVARDMGRRRPRERRPSGPILGAGDVVVVNSVGGPVCPSCGTPRPPGFGDIGGPGYAAPPPGSVAAAILQQRGMLA